ncbi:hypothetical protein [Rhodoferax saidenbachensis]|uniref:ProQ/FinO domain-containing protein n=1 Tax=Rhodoferax saidenbachensis TaxID=1484693 RepID=A0ABU1ZQG2_9BURK|nr:hypothetical protein [Rhodoferax saidenbachensis]MDR7307790.1 hypothetical protein [Rhodoferax saidenbachensis]
MNPPDSELMTYLVRMVIPIKREFGRTLDVHQFLHDVPYATEVIEEALRSKDDRLQGYAAYVQTKLFGPRGTTVPKPGAPVVADTPAPSPVVDDNAKTAALEKYKSRLR